MYTDITNKTNEHTAADRRGSRRLRAAIATLLVISLLATLLCSCVVFDEHSVASRETIEANLERVTSDVDHKYIADYLVDFGIGNINYYKLAIAQSYFDGYFYTELPSAYEMARRITEFFLDNYYDTTDRDNSDAVTDAVLRCYAAATGDKYAYYRNAAEYRDYLDDLQGNTDFVGIGIKIHVDYTALTITVNGVIPGSAAEAADIRAGDLVIGAQSSTVDANGVDDVLEHIKGNVGDSVSVTILRGSEQLTKIMTLKQYSDISVFSYMKENNIGYIAITEFNEKTTNEFKTAVDSLTAAGAEALIFDVSSNPGGLVDTAVAMIDYIVPDQNKNGDPITIMSYTIAGKEYRHTATDGHSIDLPIVVLCNEYTASAGELFTASMRDYTEWGLLNATVMGQTTFGKGILQSSVALYSSFEKADGSYLTFTMSYYYPPCGENYHGEGIEPNITLDKNDDRIAAAADYLSGILGSNGSI